MEIRPTKLGRTSELKEGPKTRLELDLYEKAERKAWEEKETKLGQQNETHTGDLQTKLNQMPANLANYPSRLFGSGHRETSLSDNYSHSLKVKMYLPVRKQVEN
jgi:hypothetical protein